MQTVRPHLAPNFQQHWISKVYAYGLQSKKKKFLMQFSRMRFCTPNSLFKDSLAKIQVFCFLGGQADIKPFFNIRDK